MSRGCDCPHPYPVCACAEGHKGTALVQRSKFLSSLAGWPRNTAPPAAPPRPTPRPAAARATPATAAFDDGPDAWLAPLRDDQGKPLPTNTRPWEGSLPWKPWQYRCTAAIVHLDAPEQLAAAVATLRAQTERPYIVVVDAGSHTAGRRALERLEAEDLEVIWLRPRAWRFTSEPVAVGMDCAFARCQTEYCYSTHVDTYLKRPDYLEWLLARCDARTPAVGYQMSERVNWSTDRWKRILSHTATMYHMPTMRRAGASWSMLGAFEALGLPPEQPRFSGTVESECVPDTEVHLSLCLERAGVGVRWLGDPDPGPEDPPSVLMIGGEPNRPYETEWLEHVRSSTGHRLYNAPLAASREQLLAAAVARALDRAATWERRAAKPRVPLGQKQCATCP